MNGKLLRGWLGLLATLALAGCVSPPVRHAGTVAQLAAQAAREQQLGAQRDWSLDGRFAASDGDHGGSGSLTWVHAGERFEFTLRAPITGKTVALQGGPEGVLLTGLGEVPRWGNDSESVLQAEFGWRIPVAALAYWVRGLRAPGSLAVLAFGADGLPASLDQDGWHVEFKAWYAQRQPPVPRKVYASRAPYSVRLLVEQWQLPH